MPNGDEYNQLQMDEHQMQLQLQELMKRIPKNPFIPNELILPIVSVIVTVALSKYNIDPKTVLQTVQGANNQVVTTYNQWVPIAIALLYAVLNGGAFAYAGVATTKRYAVQQDVARAVQENSRAIAEGHRARGLMFEARALEIKQQQANAQVSQVPVTGGTVVNVGTGPAADLDVDVDPALRSRDK